MSLQPVSGWADRVRVPRGCLGQERRAGRFGPRRGNMQGSPEPLVSLIAMLTMHLSCTTTRSGASIHASILSGSYTHKGDALFTAHTQRSPLHQIGSDTIAGDASAGQNSRTANGRELRWYATRTEVLHARPGAARSGQVLLVRLGALLARELLAGNAPIGLELLQAPAAGRRRRAR